MPTITKALNQISIMDLTDGYSVNMTQESGSFSATKDTKTAINADTVFSTTITGLQGSENIEDLKIGACIIRNASGTDITGNTNPPITVSTTNASRSGNTFTPASVTIHVYGSGAINHSAYTGEKATVEIPVYVEGTPGDADTAGDIIITKVFSISASLVGSDGQSTYIRYSATDSPQSETDVKVNPDSTTIYIGTANVPNGGGVPAYNSPLWQWSRYVGQNGQNGQDGVDYYISSSAGQFFKNTAVNTILTIHGRDANLNPMSAEDILALGTIKWYTTYDASTDEYGGEVVDGRNQLSITVDNTLVTNTTTFYVVVENESNS